MDGRCVHSGIPVLLGLTILSGILQGLRLNSKLRLYTFFAADQGGHLLPLRMCPHHAPSAANRANPRCVERVVRAADSSSMTIVK